MPDPAAPLQASKFATPPPSPPPVVVSSAPVSPLPPPEKKENISPVLVSSALRGSAPPGSESEVLSGATPNILKISHDIIMMDAINQQIAAANNPRIFDGVNTAAAKKNEGPDAGMSSINRSIKSTGMFNKDGLCTPAAGEHAVQLCGKTDPSLTNGRVTLSMKM
jgi:hypothetical protein